MKLFLTILLMFIGSVVNGQVCHDIIAGQNEVAGEVCVDIVGDQVVVTYQASEDWALDEFHLFVGSDIADMPATKKGSPKNGQFPYKGFGDDDTAIVLISAEELGVDNLRP